MRADVVPALREHVALIADDAREADVLELWAQARCTPKQAMSHGLDVSMLAWTGLLDGEPACMFGVTPFSILRGMGTPWMVGSNKLNSLSAQKHLLRASREHVALMESRFPFLFNTVDDRNESAKRWLAWLGFRFGDPIPYGADGLPFRPFWKGAPHV